MRRTAFALAAGILLLASSCGGSEEPAPSPRAEERESSPAADESPVESEESPSPSEEPAADSAAIMRALCDRAYTLYELPSPIFGATIFTELNLYMPAEAYEVFTFAPGIGFGEIGKLSRMDCRASTAVGWRPVVEDHVEPAIPDGLRRKIIRSSFYAPVWFLIDSPIGLGWIGPSIGFTVLLPGQPLSDLLSNLRLVTLEDEAKGGGLPDLTLTASGRFHEEGEACIPGQFISDRSFVSIRNAGRGVSPRVFETSIRGRTWTVTLARGLEPGEAVVFVLSPPQLPFEIDPNDRIEESDEGNNSFVVPASPPLVCETQ